LITLAAEIVAEPPVSLRNEPRLRKVGAHRPTKIPISFLPLAYRQIEVAMDAKLAARIRSLFCLFMPLSIAHGTTEFPVDVSQALGSSSRAFRVKGTVSETGVFGTAKAATTKQWKACLFLFQNLY